MAEERDLQAINIREAPPDDPGEPMSGIPHSREIGMRLHRSAGGKAVLAHPWSRGTHKVLTPEVIASLVDHGLDGIEVDHADHDSDDRAALRQIVKENDLILTGSSDYHGSGKSDDFRLGANTTDPEEFERLLA